MLGVNIVGTLTHVLVSPDLLLITHSPCRVACYHPQARYRLVHLCGVDVRVGLEPPAEAHASLGASTYAIQIAMG